MPETSLSDEVAAARQKLARLLGFLERDPENAKLLADAAHAAFEAKDFDRAAELLDRRAALQPLPPALANLRGKIALATEDYAQALQIFDELVAAGHDAPAVRFNLAWALAMTRKWQAALNLLDEDTLAASPRAPGLKVRMLHQQGRIDEGLISGEDLLVRFPDNRDLLGAVATIALDAEEPELAREFAERAPGNAEAEAALGVLALGDHDAAASLALFDRAVALQPDNPRAWVGRGLAQAALGETASAAAAIDRGAELFGDHVGSWIAAGWAHFVAGDHAKARECFEKAHALDSTFSESHGGLAVLDIAAGDLDSARRRCEIALRLDWKSFGGALAKSLLLDSAGQSGAAQKIREMALTMPVGAGGTTIAQAMTGFGVRRR
jgi:tetratricopeptide (TPR) repeat protein